MSLAAPSDWTTTFSATDGPRLRTFISYGIAVPARAVLGAFMDIARSAVVATRTVGNVRLRRALPHFATPRLRIVRPASTALETFAGSTPAIVCRGLTTPNRQTTLRLTAEQCGCPDTNFSVPGSVILNTARWALVFPLVVTANGQL